MNEFKKKYMANFTMITPADKGDLVLLLKTLIELKSEFGISIKSILFCHKPMCAISIGISYKDAKAVIRGELSEDAYIERNRRDRR